jgi:hypothetical protein
VCVCVCVCVACQSRCSQASVSFYSSDPWTHLRRGHGTPSRIPDRRRHPRHPRIHGSHVHRPSMRGHLGSERIRVCRYGVHVRGDKGCRWPKNSTETREIRRLRHARNARQANDSMGNPPSTPSGRTSTPDYCIEHLTEQIEPLTSKRRGGAHPSIIGTIYIPYLGQERLLQGSWPVY